MKRYVQKKFGDLGGGDRFRTTPSSAVWMKFDKPAETSNAVTMLGGHRGCFDAYHMLHVCDDDGCLIEVEDDSPAEKKEKQYLKKKFGQLKEGDKFSLSDDFDVGTKLAETVTVKEYDKHWGYERNAIFVSDMLLGWVDDEEEVIYLDENDQPIEVEVEQELFNTVTFGSLKPGQLFKETPSHHILMKTAAGGAISTKNGKSTEVHFQRKVIPVDMGCQENPFDLDDAVREFHNKHHVPMSNKIGGDVTYADDYLALSLIAEEYSELIRAASKDDEIAIADALGDLAYVVYGMSARYGIRLNPVVAEIHRSNMTKDVDSSNNGKVNKGVNYEPPDISGVLSKQGWQRLDW